MIIYRGFQAHMTGEVCRFFLNSLVEEADTRIVVSTVGLRIDLDDNRTPLPLLPGTGIYFEAAIFHADETAPHVASISRRIEFVRLHETEEGKYLTEHFGTGTDFPHQAVVSENHHQVAACIEKMLQAGERFGKVAPPASSSTYDW